MSNHLSGPRRLEQHRQRLAWLATHPTLLARLPGIAHDVSPTESEALEETLRAMRLVRLYAPTASSAASRWSIRLCVSELRGQTVARGELAVAHATPRRI
jgi:hypothetical protein